MTREGRELIHSLPSKKWCCELHPDELRFRKPTGFAFTRDDHNHPNKTSSPDNLKIRTNNRNFENSIKTVLP